MDHLSEDNIDDQWERYLNALPAFQARYGLQIPIEKHKYIEGPPLAHDVEQQPKGKPANVNSSSHPQSFIGGNACESRGLSAQARQDDKTSEQQSERLLNEGQQSSAPVCPEGQKPSSSTTEFKRNQGIMATIRALGEDTSSSEVDSVRPQAEAEKKASNERVKPENPEPSDEESSSSDEVVFRQDEHNMVGPRLRPNMFNRANLMPPQPSPTSDFPSMKASPSVLTQNGQSNTGIRQSSSPVDPPKRPWSPPVSPPIVQQRQQGPQHKKVRKQNQQAKPQDRPKSEDRAALDRKAELLRLQEQERLKFSKRMMGEVSDDSPETGPLYLARQGPGTDANGEFCKQMPYKVLTAPENGIKGLGDQIARLPNNNQVQVNTWNSIDAGATGPVIVDWLYKPWMTSEDDNFARIFRNWLENTINIGYPVDMESKDFKNGNHHADGVSELKRGNFEAEETIIDPSDLENAHIHETSAGYMHNWNLRLEREREEKEKEEAQEKEERLQRRILTPTLLKGPDEQPLYYSPKINMYIRPVEPKDIPAVLALLNWYVKNTTRLIEMEEYGIDELREHITEIETQKLPFIVAVEKRNGMWQAKNTQDEMVFGFASVFDFGGPTTTQKYTGEVEVFVHPKMHRFGIGRCLIDKIVEVCDPGYVGKQGYLFDSGPDRLDVFHGGKCRRLMRLVMIVHLKADDPSEYNWIAKWLKQDFNFEEQGMLKGTGWKDKKMLNSGYLVRNTGVVPKE
ncbi:hypothetical protein FQN57_001839 [Myotisia sp. PD_48]|nr:hypothetical protein FQN57_001839 [Myotisia sp. PD_48]